MGLRDLLAGLFGASRPLRLERVSEVDESQDPDEQVLAQLRAAGADIRKPTHTLFYIYASTEDGANRISNAIADLQLEVEVRPAALGNGWLCLAQGQLIPSLDVLKAYRVRFDTLAAREGGEYDGWEAAVTK